MKKSYNIRDENGRDKGTIETDFITSLRRKSPIETQPVEEFSAAFLVG
jgi:hypothetical protein